LLNELEVNDSWSQGLDLRVTYRNALESATGVTWHTYWVNRYGSSTATSGIGELILSRYPLIATRAKALDSTRSACDVTVDVNGRTVNFASTHLDSTYQSTRLAEIAALLPWETTLPENRIVLGDYNAWPGTTEIVTMPSDHNPVLSVFNIQ
jgi:endonuclease/exonuclease/phosphatase family metal-dependent hydrolase